ncbi:hypothetical protein FLW53_09340 [Microbispora sp. SCL1-1]|uniref:hypothetical protein n=1 Tax=unclassified Microbispora TaxID=2614687 RepID=UPI0011584166|nr:MULTISPECIES: hypothetical protein [unclassified Microbispora]NJP24402.1 hypothetical protein [Microbispora sp. CL1-1]TQS14556.1 hypothetical protein FLW53_09340 [Microbispora sp. SCL1-1]
MTALQIETTAAERLEDLAVRYLNEDWTTSDETELYHFAHHDRAEEAIWALFEDLAEAVRLRNGVGDGTVHWSAVCDELTGWDPSEAAWEIAQERVDELTYSLLFGRTR